MEANYPAWKDHPRGFRGANSDTQSIFAIELTDTGKFRTWQGYMCMSNDDFKPKQKVVKDQLKNIAKTDVVNQKHILDLARIKTTMEKSTSGLDQINIELSVYRNPTFDRRQFTMPGHPSQNSVLSNVSSAPTLPSLPTLPSSVATGTSSVPSGQSSTMNTSGQEVHKMDDPMDDQTDGMSGLDALNGDWLHENINFKYLGESQWPRKGWLFHFDEKGVDYTRVDGEENSQDVMERVKKRSDITQYVLEEEKPKKEDQKKGCKRPKFHFEEGFDYFLAPVETDLFGKIYEDSFIRQNVDYLTSLCPPPENEAQAKAVRDRNTNKVKKFYGFMEIFKKAEGAKMYQRTGKRDKIKNILRLLNRIFSISYKK